MASNQSGTAVAEAIVPAMPPTAPFDETTLMTWVPKQRETLAAGPDAVQPAFHAVDGPFATDPGELLRLRIISRVLSDRAAAERDRTERAATAERERAEHVAAAERERLALDAAAEQERAAAEAVGQAKEAAARKVREAAARKKAEETARREAEEAEATAAALRAEEERLAALAVSYVKPVASCTMSGGFGSAGSPWAVSNSGQDFAVPTGTPAVAVHSGTITAAGWAGAHGYRIVLTLDDGTQLWYCNLSSMVKTSGRVLTGDVIGRAGATGNASAPSLHLEVRPSGLAPVDPLDWLREHGVAV